MDNIQIIIASALSLITLICFFVLCSNVSQIKKHLCDNFKEYTFYRTIGDKEKAYLFLLRDYLINYESNKYKVSNYYTNFKELGKIPDLKEFQDLHQKETSR